MIETPFLYEIDDEQELELGSIYKRKKKSKMKRLSTLEFNFSDLSAVRFLGKSTPTECPTSPNKF